MSFLHPKFFHLLWLIPVLVGLRLWLGNGKAAESMVAARLRDLLVVGVSRVRSWTVFIFQLLALTGFVCALVGPRYGVEKREITETGKDVILAIDTSRSMLADDVTPNRLMRAKLAAQDIVLTLQGEKVGLVAFAGRGYLQAPLTTDHEAVIESLQSLDTNTIPRGGTEISDAVREALEAFEKSKARTHGLILFSDGGEEDSHLAAMLAKAKEKRVVILTVGVGTDTGSLIPDPEPEKSGDFIRDPSSNKPVHTRLEEATLQRMAKETGGRYLRLGSQALSSSVVASVMGSLDSIENGSREEVKPIDRFYWPLSVGMLFLMLALLLRPTASSPRLSPVAALLLVLFSIGPSRAEAGIFTPNDSTKSAEEALQSYQNRDYAEARDLYSRLLSDEPPPGDKERFSYGLGAACQQLKDYDRAIESFSKSLESHDKQLQLQSHQGLGVALYDQGAKAVQQQPEFTAKAWTDSLRHLESASAMSNDPKTKENLDFVRQQLAQLKQQMKQDQDKQKKKGKKDKNKGNGDKDKSDAGSESEEDGDPNSDGQGNKDGKQGKQSQDKDGQQKQGESADGKDKDQKEAQQGKEGDEKEDGKDGQAMEQQQPQKGPEGKIQAAEQGDGSQKEGSAEAMMAEEKKQDQTGYSRNEARNLLRTYNDLMTTQKPNRRERTVAKDW